MESSDSALRFAFRWEASNSMRSARARSSILSEHEVRSELPGGAHRRRTVLRERGGMEVMRL